MGEKKEGLDQTKQIKKKKKKNTARSLIFMPATLKKLGGHIAFGLPVHPYVMLFRRTVYARILKFHKCITKTYSVALI